MQEKSIHILVQVPPSDVPLQKGHACPPHKQEKIGRWLSDMRGLYSRNQLAATKVKAVRVRRGGRYAVPCATASIVDRGDEPSLTGAKMGGQLKEAGVEFDGLKARVLREQHEIGRGLLIAGTRTHESLADSRCDGTAP